MFYYIELYTFLQSSFKNVNEEVSTSSHCQVVDINIYLWFVNISNSQNAGVSYIP